MYRVRYTVTIMHRVEVAGARPFQSSGWDGANAFEDPNLNWGRLGSFYRPFRLSSDPAADCTDSVTYFDRTVLA